MISIYFDQEFIELFGKRSDLSDPVVFDFFNQFIKKIRGIKIFVNIDSLDEVKELVMNNEMYSLISEIAPIKLSNFKDQLSNPEFYKDGSITKLFFVENCDENELQRKNNYHFISNKTLTEKWKLFLSDREDSELIIKSNSQPSEEQVFRSWADFNFFAHKIKNILVFDFFVMGNKTNQKIEKNLLPCIKELIKNNKVNVEDLTIYTKELANNSKKKKERQGLWEESDFTLSFKLLESLRTGVNNISFIKYDESKNIGADSEHNRFILTNYFFIRVEAGLNIFKDNGNVNNRDTIRFDSIFKNKTRNIVVEALKNINKYTSQLKEKDDGVIGQGKKLEHYNYFPLLNCPFLNKSQHP